MNIVHKRRACSIVWCGYTTQVIDPVHAEPHVIAAIIIIINDLVLLVLV